MNDTERISQERLNTDVTIDSRQLRKRPTPELN